MSPMPTLFMSLVDTGLHDNQTGACHVACDMYLCMSFLKHNTPALNASCGCLATRSLQAYPYYTSMKGFVSITLDPQRSKRFIGFSDFEVRFCAVPQDLQKNFLR